MAAAALWMWAAPATDTAMAATRRTAPSHGNSTKSIVRPTRHRSRKSNRPLKTTLSDVDSAVEDWSRMRERARSLVTALEHSPPPVPADDVAEARHLLGWMEARHFVFLGYRHYTLERGGQEDRLVPEPRSGLGILRDGKRKRKGSPGTALRGDVRAKAREPEILISRRPTQPRPSIGTSTSTTSA